MISYQVGGLSGSVGGWVSQCLMLGGWVGRLGVWVDGLVHGWVDGWLDRYKDI